MIVDCHAHLVPPDLLDRHPQGRGASFPTCGRSSDGGVCALAFAGGKPTRPVSKPLSRHCRRGWPGWTRTASTNRSSAAGSTCSATNCRAPKAEAWARLANDALLAAAKAEPRFVPLATVPLSDGARAATVLKAAMAAGFPAQ